MGRHSGELRGTVRRDRSLLGWGLFLAAATVAAALMTGVDLVGAALAAGGLVLIFTALWFFSPRPRQDG